MNDAERWFYLVRVVFNFFACLYTVRWMIGSTPSPDKICATNP